MFACVERAQAHYPVARLGRVLGVSPSGYDAWRGREPSARAREDVVLTAAIVRISQESRRISGAPRMHADLAEGGVRCGRKRVARLMRAAGIEGCHRRRAPPTTQRATGVEPASDRVRRQVGADAPDRLWTADITYVPTWSGCLSLAVVLAVFSRRIGGWAMADHLRTALVLSAREMALWHRRPAEGVIHHSDQGSQDTSAAFGQRCQAAGVVPSMGSRGDCSDNAITEAFFATLECELLSAPPLKHAWPCSTTSRGSPTGSAAARHSGIGLRSPTSARCS